MKIGITIPTNWPWVRRGGERFSNELAAFLVSRGHDVTLICGKPGPKLIRRERGFTTICHRRLWHPSFARIGFLEFHAFFPIALASMLWHRFDVVHCTTFIDAYAGIVSRTITNTPCIFWANALPPRIQYFRSLTLRGAIFRRAVRQSDEAMALSRYMRDDFVKRFGRACTIMPVPVDTERFPLRTDRDRSHPKILCTAALDDERKGGPTLMRAFNRLKARRPELILQLSGHTSDDVRSQLLELIEPRWRKDVHFLGVGAVEDLPALYGQAAVTVLPSMWEAFGMVILESLATGTPVVGTNDGAIPELLSDPMVGRLCEPGADATTQMTNVNGLMQALDETLDLSRQPDTASRCRAHAMQYSWHAVGPRFERTYERVIEARRPKRRKGA
ncbi:MAG: glycosyltransferase family 4 protein [Phycisphaerae bacterium]|jgi:phosphatidylinositol alpha-mannosyltransferase